MPRLTALLPAFLLVSTAVCRAPAQGAETALAESLYREGRRLMDAKRYGEACPKLEESLRLESAGGTELALALCYEGDGRLASAWGLFQAGLATARRSSRPDREKLAQDGLRRLEGRVPMLTVVVPPEIAALEGLRVRCGRLVLGSGVWGTEVPVDPGTIEVEATASGRRFSTQLTIAPSDRRTVTIGALDAPATDAAPAPAPARARRPGPQEPLEARGTSLSRRTVAGLVVGGAGVVALAAGTAAGLIHFSKLREADRRCPEIDCSDPEAVASSHDARVFGGLSIAGLALGTAGVGVGTYLLLTPSDRSPNAVGALRVWIHPKGATFGSSF